MTAVTLTAGNGSFGNKGYFSSVYAAAYGELAAGSLSAQPLAGHVIEALYTSGGGGVGYLVLRGNTSSQGPFTLTVDGADWDIYFNNYDPTNAGFSTYTTALADKPALVSGTDYTVDLILPPDITAPTITSSDSASVAENATLSHSLTADESVTWSVVGGADQAQFEISGSTLRWADDGTKDYENPTDANADNAYVVTIRATDAASNTTDQTITVTVTGVYEGPTWVGVSTALGSTSSGTINFKTSGRAAGDKLFVAIATANQAIATPSGFTEVPGVSPQSRGTAGAAGGIRLALFEKIGTGSETTVSIADSGNHQYAVGFVVRPAAGKTIEIAASAGKNAAASTSHSGNALAAVPADCLILDVWGTDRDAASPSYSDQANADLANLTERYDAGTTQGAGSGIVIYTGERAAAGSIAATTATSSANAAWCAITLALVAVAPEPIYKGAIGASIYRGVRSEAQLYRGARDLFA